MRKIHELKNIISQKSNILIIYNPEKGLDATSAGLAFFNFLNKFRNVNVIPKKIPPQLKEFVKTPKAICDEYYSIEIKAKNIESIFYEKDDTLKIYLVANNGQIKDDDIVVKEVVEKCERCDLFIAIGFEKKDDYLKTLKEYNLPEDTRETVCINNNENCENFGKINISAKSGFSLCELLTFILKHIDEAGFDKDVGEILIFGIKSFWDGKTLPNKTLEIINYLTQINQKWNSKTLKQ